MNDEEYEKTCREAENFMENDARRIQWKLYLKWLTSGSYVDDWWRQYVYNIRRDSLLRTNIGGTDFLYRHFTKNQAACAATLAILKQRFTHETAQYSTEAPVRNVNRKVLLFCSLSSDAHGRYSNVL